MECFGELQEGHVFEEDGGSLCGAARDSAAELRTGSAPSKLFVRQRNEKLQKLEEDWKKGIQPKIRRSNSNCLLDSEVSFP